MNAIASLSQNTLSRSDSAIREALKASLYPGAADSSIDMVMAYCMAAGLDPMAKPVHIVPIWDKATKSMRDTVMPGIGLYRIIADRTGKYAGQDDAEFGPEMENWGIRFPQWCKVTLYKITPCGRVPYSAKVFWLEAYSVAGRDTDAPNAMWKKRPYGQLEKCAEAAALRKAFPEVGAQPTADEMEGKIIESSIVHEPESSSPPPLSATDAIKNRMKARAAVVDTLEKIGAMPPPDVEVNPETGEWLSAVEPAEVDALVAAIQAAPHNTALRSLRVQVESLAQGSPERQRAAEAYKARSAEFKAANGDSGRK